MKITKLYCNYDNLSAQPQHKLTTIRRCLGTNYIGIDFCTEVKCYKCNLMLCPFKIYGNVKQTIS